MCLFLMLTAILLVEYLEVFLFFFLFVFFLFFFCFFFFVLKMVKNYPLKKQKQLQ